MTSSVFKQIVKKIKEYDEIVIARHIGPDPDAIASTIALRDMIKFNFPNKKVYAVGSGVSRFKYFGVLDKIDEKEEIKIKYMSNTIIRVKRMSTGNIDSIPFEELLPCRWD